MLKYLVLFLLIAAPAQAVTTLDSYVKACQAKEAAMPHYRDKQGKYWQKNPTAPHWAGDCQIVCPVVIGEATRAANGDMAANPGLDALGGIDAFVRSKQCL
jgi:hypothetical protein